jgi:hypothetical protein
VVAAGLWWRCSGGLHSDWRKKRYNGFVVLSGRKRGRGRCGWRGGRRFREEKEAALGTELLVDGGALDAAAEGDAARMPGAERAGCTWQVGARSGGRALG